LAQGPVPVRGRRLGAKVVKLNKLRDLNRFSGLQKQITPVGGLDQALVVDANN